MTEEELREVQLLLDVGEYGLALENTVDIYVDEQKSPWPEVLFFIEKLATSMSMVPTTMLKRLLK